MITVNKDITADNTDVLQGTDLENIPEPGVLRIYAKSTASDSQITITAPGQGTPVRSQLIQKGADAVVSLVDDIPIDIPVQQGKYVVDVNVTTAATVKIVAIFYTVEEAMAEAGIV